MAFAIALVVAVVATPVAAAAARALGVVDRPGPLKVHRAPVPYLGGTAVFLAISVALATSDGDLDLLVPLAFALVIGVADDVRPLSPVVRLVSEVAVAATAAVVAPAPGPLGELVTAVIVLGLLNAWNLVDGLDGLAAGCAFVAALGFALVGGTDSLSLAVAGAALGFLVFNRPPARIYLGDGGSYLIGTAIALLAVLATAHDDTVATWAALPLLVLVPVLDTTVAIVRRARLRRPLFAGDRSHVYDQLADRGLGPRWATLVCVAAQAAFAGGAVLVAGLDAPAAVAVSAVTTVLVLLALGSGGLLSSSDDTGSP